MSVHLAVETATSVGSVAVGEPGRPLCETVFTDRRHAAALLPAAMEALRMAGAGVADLRGVVVADGPGSFTGLRIGVATVKGLLLGRESIGLQVAPSLLGAAWASRQFADGPVAALYDALRGEVFVGIYDFGAGGVRCVVPPACRKVSTLERVSPVRPVLAVGEGAVAYPEAVRTWTGRDPVGPPAGVPRASALIEMLAVPGALTTVDDVDAFEPEYGRPAAAQVRWEREHGRPLPPSGGDPG